MVLSAEKRRGKWPAEGSRREERFGCPNERLDLRIQKSLHGGAAFLAKWRGIAVLR
jgi:hypothetical protein